MIKTNQAIAVICSSIEYFHPTGFVGNVVVALGNSHRPDAALALAGAMSDASALVRGHAAWALGQIDIPEARAELEKA